ncbi:hypothetical protein [Bacteroides sp. OF04-15BH]|uniref:hypothetical protein n=1 Tax=Bacteroides sp. OF04-15BH TaxID=2292281 RepID=UPI0018F39B17|nr:hypothetical protein [Bacteroides sp. OF04-15BH]
MKNTFLKNGAKLQRKNAKGTPGNTISQKKSLDFLSPFHGKARAKSVLIQKYFTPF